MLRETLMALEADVERLLFAGGAVALSDEGLQVRGSELAAVGATVSALVRIAETIKGLGEATPREAAHAVLTLAALVGRTRGVQAEPAGTSGTLEALAQAPRLASPLPAADVEALHRALHRSAGLARVEAVQAALEQDGVADIRLLDAWLAALGDPSVGSLVAREVLPVWGVPSRVHCGRASRWTAGHPTGDGW